MNILIVEDEPVARMLLCRMAGRHHCVVRAAASASEALELLRAHPCDLVILDSHLPDMHGAEVVEVVRREHRPALVIVAISTDDTAGNIRRMKDAGADEFLVKPLTAEEFEKLLQRWRRQNPPPDSEKEPKHD
jgi:CheY-like chemotaxis protein